ncbi:mandelate racemase/muconate lactonizing protein [Candidatus Bathyarchaeota archaeon]|nr:mandelate racemase/muconate lactonizing protein [Candidatus Bathyarchaeota archaeon]
MQIKDIRSFKLRGPWPYGEDFWKERLVMPLDIYPKFRSYEGRRVPRPPYLEQTFLEIITDEGISGIYGPIGSSQASFIQNAFRNILIGEDPFRIEMLWDQMYRSQVHGRKGETMMAISAVDCALWDLIGKAKGEPVVRLLGGPLKEEMPAYASTLGCSLDPQEVSKVSQAYVEEGFRALKWFFRYGPGDGEKGMERNLQLVKAVRDAVGYEVDLMLDCWMSWTIPYTLKMAKRLERYEPAWLEEPLMPDDIDGYAQLAKALEIPIAGGEHEYTRWGAKELLTRQAVDILQMDVTWAGGITEMRKVCALASAFGIPLIPHASWTEPSQHLVFSQNITVCPMIEYLVKHSVDQQAFNREKLKPEKGVFKAPIRKRGLGFEPEMERLVSEGKA